MATTTQDTNVLFLKLAVALEELEKDEAKTIMKVLKAKGKTAIDWQIPPLK